MVEPKARTDALDPFATEAKASVSMFDEKTTLRTHSLPQPYRLHLPSPHVGPFYHLSPKAAMDPGHYAQTIVNLEAELQRVHKELHELKEQLGVSEAEKAQAVKEFTSIKNLLDQISLVEHFAASDNVEVEAAPLPPNWSGGSSVEEIDRLRSELDASKDLNSKFAAELEKTKQEIDESRHRRACFEAERGSVYLELENARKDISTLQATLSDAWSHHGACSLELARAKDEIAWLEADLESAQRLTTDLAHAKDDIAVLHEDLEVARGLQKSTSIALLKAKEEISKLRTQVDASSSLQADLDALRVLHDASTRELHEISLLRDAALSDARGEIRRLETELAALRDGDEEKMGRVKATLEFVKGQYDETSAELAETSRQMEKLRGELEALRIKYECCSLDLLNAKKDAVEQLASHESLMTDIRIAQEENLKLQVALKAENVELGAASRDVARLQGELSELQEQHRECAKLRSFQTELGLVEELHHVVVGELTRTREDVATLQQVSTSEFHHCLESVRDLKIGVGELQSDLPTQYTGLLVENSRLEQKATDLASKLTATDTRLQEASGAQAKLAAVRSELVTKLESMTREVEDLKAQRADMDAVRTELDAVRKSEASYREQVEGLKVHMYAMRDAEAKAKESLVSVSSELQKKRIEFEMAKEALEWVGGDAARLTAELEALKAEVTSTKEGEARARAAFTDYSLKLQKMRLDLEDATKLADKARTFKLDLDDATAKLAKVVESERIMAASMASLKAELNNVHAELEDHGAALAEKDQQHELELSQMRAQWEAAILSEATLTDANFALNESLIKVMAEAEEAAVAKEEATRGAEKAREEVEHAEARIETFEAKLETLQFEVEAARASEDWAFSQMRLKTIPEADEEEGDIPVSFEQYQSVKAKARELQELVNKRAAVAVAQVNEAKASAREMQGRIESLERELRACRTELAEAVAKREEAEAAKFSCEAALRAKRLERKSLSHSGTLNGGHPNGKFMNVGDRQGSMNSICFEDSQSSSPSRSSKSFASFASPGRSERSPMESIAHVAITRTPVEEKQRKPKLSSKIGAYFSKRKGF